MLERGDENVIRRVAQLPPSQLAATIITVEEKMAGRLARIRRASGAADTAIAYRNLTLTCEYLSHFSLPTYDEPAIARFETLRAAKLNVGAMDLRIAAIVLEAGATLVTRNFRDFARVPDLVFENWADA